MDNSIQSRELKEALEFLEKAGVVYRVKQTGGEGLPLEANANERHFKTIFLDIGLMQNLCGLGSEILMVEDFIRVNAGEVAEQFVGQELLAYSDPFKESALYYWARESRSSNAELDYLTPYQQYALPVEVKAGKTGTLRSMHLFLEKYPAPLGIRVSQIPLRSIRRFINIEKYQYYSHALTEAKKDGVEPEDIVYVLLTGKIIESYPDRQRVLIYGEMLNKLPLHVVCDYSDEDMIYITTVYIPSQGRMVP